MKLNKAILNLEIVDEETGEITSKEVDVADLLATAVAKKPVKRSSSSSSSKIEENDTPILRLDDNKYSLTSGAIEALGLEPGESKLVIRYQKIGTTMVPIIGTNDSFGIKAGNKLTLKGTVSYRGKNNEELSEYGSEFILVKHPSADNLYVLTADGNLPEGNYEMKKSSSKKSSPSKPKKEVPQPEPEDVSDLEEMLDNVDNTEVSSDSLDFTL